MAANMAFTRVVTVESDSNDSLRDIISYVFNPQDLKGPYPNFYHIRFFESDTCGNDIFEVYVFPPGRLEPTSLFFGTIQDCLEFAYFN